MKTVLVFGTFDRFHPGHVFFLTEAKKYGDRLVVVVARDRNVWQLKGRWPTQLEPQRLAVVQQFSAVAEARLGLKDFTKRYDIIKLINPQVVCLGYDQAPDFHSLDPTIKVIRLPAFYPEKYKSIFLT